MPSPPPRVRQALVNLLTRVRAKRARRELTNAQVTRLRNYNRAAKLYENAHQRYVKLNTNLGYQQERLRQLHPNLFVVPPGQGGFGVFGGGGGFGPFGAVAHHVTRNRILALPTGKNGVPRTINMRRYLQLYNQRQAANHNRNARHATLVNASGNLIRAYRGPTAHVPNGHMAVTQAARLANNIRYTAGRRMTNILSTSMLDPAFRVGRTRFARNMEAINRNLQRAN
jgi:hypothetical protein